jgi:hypothetical protein
MIRARGSFSIFHVSASRTPLYAGKIRRAPGKRSLLYKLNTYKKVYVRLDDSASTAGKAVGAAKLA